MVLHLQRQHHLFPMGNLKHLPSHQVPPLLLLHLIAMEEINRQLEQDHHHILIVNK